MNKQDELLSRREFFQKAVEKTLPIIGFVALGNLLQAWWDRMAQKYRWESSPEGNWTINFDTCEITLNDGR